VNKTCTNCNKNYEIKRWQDNRKKPKGRLFCSQKCHGEHRSRHAIYQTKNYSPNRNPSNVLFTNYKTVAKKRGFDFSLTKEQFLKLIKQNCFYCGSPPQRRKHYDSYYNANGVDRMDNERGYDVENVVPCCLVCNRMKLHLPITIFLEHIKKIIRHTDG